MTSTPVRAARTSTVAAVVATIAAIISIVAGAPAQSSEVSTKADNSHTTVEWGLYSEPIPADEDMR